MENVTIVETHGLTKRHGSGVHAVDCIARTVHGGKVYGILGPTGQVPPFSYETVLDS